MCLLIIHCSYFHKYLFQFIYDFVTECYNNGICEDNEQCRDGICQTVIHHISECGWNSWHIAKNHKALCVCPPRFGGDPYDGCRKSKYR